jgi:phosphatidylserine decarboxylase
MIRIILTILSAPLVSRLWGRITRLRRPRGLVRRMIRAFQRHYGIDMRDYPGQPDDYSSLNQFFIRPLDPTARPLVAAADFLLSPCDGVLSTLECIDHDQAFQVKGKPYRVSELLQSALDFSRPWLVAVIYLAPHNYHRFHYPLAGRISGFNHCRGRLYSVNNLAVRAIDRLYVRNERMLLRLEHGTAPVYIAAVGACLVGHLHLEAAPPGIYGTGWRTAAVAAAQLAEMGRFETGSTIVMVWPADLTGEALVATGQTVRVGDRLFPLQPHS